MYEAKDKKGAQMKQCMTLDVTNRIEVDLVARPLAPFPCPAIRVVAGAEYVAFHGPRHTTTAPPAALG